MDKYQSLIHEKVGLDNSHLGENKSFRIKQPESYDGSDSITAFEEWLQKVLRCFEGGRVTGPRKDGDRVLYMGNLVTGKASEWYDIEVNGEHRPPQGWKFADLVCAMFIRFVNISSAQDAAALYDAVRYKPENGIQGLDW